MSILYPVLYFFMVMLSVVMPSFNILSFAMLSDMATTQHNNKKRDTKHYNTQSL
jgi:hypothetical protein